MKSSFTLLARASTGAAASVSKKKAASLRRALNRAPPHEAVLQNYAKSIALETQQQQQQVAKNMEVATLAPKPLSPPQPPATATTTASTGNVPRSKEAANVTPVNRTVPKKMPEFKNSGLPNTTERFTELVNIFKNAAECLTDVEEPHSDAVTIIHQSEQEPSLDSKTLSKADVVLSSRTFSAAMTCPKKFFLLQYRPDLLPRETIGEAVRYDDAATFSELARRWDRLQFGSKATLIDATDFEEAQKQTEKIILDYFAANASLGEQAPTLTLHRPAFEGPCVPPAGAEGVASVPPLVLRARPLVVRYRPKDNQWVILLSQAVIDPMSSASKASQCLQRIHFTMRAFRNWVTQPHIPIPIRKRFLTVNVDPDGAGGRREDTAPFVAPIDVKRSGILHIRQYFPGPVSVLDCDPQKLVKYIQRLPLEDLLQEECKAIARGGGVFERSQLGKGPLHPVIQKRYEEMRESAATAFPAGKVRSSRSLKKRDTCEKGFFEHQQELMASILTHYVPSLIIQCHDPAQRKRWLSFSCDGSGCAGGAAALEGSSANGKPKAAAVVKGKKASPPPPPPCYSEHLGAHCVKGDTCPFFIEGKCLPEKVDDPLATRNNHLFSLPSSAVTRKVAWWSEGLRTVDDICKGHAKGIVKLSAPQLRYAQAVISGKMCINPSVIDTFFQNIRYPLFILDFEATAYAVPPHRKVVAYQSVPFQFSLDVFQHDILTETPKHYDFLHFGKGYSPNQDPRRACINELMRIVKVEREKKRLELLSTPAPADAAEGEAELDSEAGTRRGRGRPPKPKAPGSGGQPLTGPITPYDGCFLAHYAAFEKSCLEKLGMLEEMYKEDIKGFFFLDTLELLKKGVVHPNAHGSNSLKKILPALCPDFQYGVFGVESPNSASSSNSGGGGAAAAPQQQDEQQGENAMGLYRMWHHHEGGDSLRQLIARTSKSLRLPPSVDAKEREKVWTMLRIQLLEYCSMDTKAIYEIMREIWRIKEEASGTPAVTDKSGWVFVEPSSREMTY